MNLRLYVNDRTYHLFQHIILIMQRDNKHTNFALSRAVPHSLQKFAGT